MKPAHLTFLLVLTAAGTAAAGTSANYTLAPDTLDSGGLRATGAACTIDSSLAPGSTSSSVNYTLSTGFAGQLFDTAPTSSQPEIVVEQPAGTIVTDGGICQFGTVTLGAGILRTFTVRNSGSAPLTGLSITIDGADAPMFSVASAPAAPLAVGSSITFSIRFTPAGAGPKSAALHITSNDSDESPFDITLTGTGSALVIDFDINSFRFTGAGGRDIEVKFDTAAGATYRLLTSPTMVPGSWTDSGLSIPGTGAEQLVILPDLGLSMRQFFRVVKQ